MGECKLCRQGDPSITVSCWSCRQFFHIHQVQLDVILEGDVVLGDCPGCRAVNCWLKRGKGVVFSGPVIYDGQPILDLRSGIPPTTGLGEQISTLKNEK